MKQGTPFVGNHSKAPSQSNKASCGELSNEWWPWKKNYNTLGANKYRGPYTPQKTNVSPKKGLFQ